MLPSLSFINLHRQLFVAYNGYGKLLTALKSRNKGVSHGILFKYIHPYLPQQRKSAFLPPYLLLLHASPVYDTPKHNNNVKGDNAHDERTTYY